MEKALSAYYPVAPESVGTCTVPPLEYRRGCECGIVTGPEKKRTGTSKILQYKYE